MKSTFFDNLKEQLQSINANSEQQENLQWRLLYEISSFLTARNLDLDAILTNIVDGAIYLTGADRGLLLQYDPPGVLRVQLSRDVNGSDAHPRAISHSIVQEVMHSREILYIPHLAADQRFARCESVLDLKLGAVMCAPLKVRIREAPCRERRRYGVAAQSRILGVLYLDSLTSGRPFGQKELYLLQILANQATAILTSAKIYQRASIDQLTNFLVRRQFDLSLEDEVMLGEASGRPFSLIYLDIDRFRHIIERHGYRAGDRIIARIANIIAHNLRVTDICGRLGGDKFAVLLPGSTQEDGMRIAGKLCGLIAAENFLEDVRLTISAGVCDYTGDQDAQTLSTRADQALFKAKSMGPGQVYSWHPGISAQASTTDKLAGILTGDYSQDYRNVLLLLETINAVNTTRDLRQLFPLIVNSMMDITGARRGILYLCEGPQLVAAEKSLRGQDKITTAVDESIAQEVTRSGQPYFRDDPQGRIACLPLASGRKILGAIYVDYLESEGAFPLTFFVALTKELSIALENARLHAQLREKCVELEKSKAKVEELAAELSAKVERQSVELAEVREVLTKNIADFKGSMNYGEIIGASAAMRRVYAIIERVAPTTLPILIQGESGTGKELVARAIHFNSRRARGRFLSENCAAISESLLASELFGHVKGAFTGAVAHRKGLFELAHGGTLFLDEIGNMSLELQAKLLRILEESQVRRVGGQEKISVDVRIITASNKDLKELMAAGRFREDFFYRINVVTIDLPPLRDRKEDIPALIAHFMQNAGIASKRLTTKAQEVLLRHMWPGNVRELKNVIEKLVVLAESDVIDEQEVLAQLPHLEEQVLTEPLKEIDFRTARRAFERAFIERALVRNQGNVSRAAREAGIARRHFYELMHKLGIRPKKQWS